MAMPGRVRRVKPELELSMDEPEVEQELAGSAEEHVQTLLDLPPSIVVCCATCASARSACIASLPLDLG